MNLLRALLDAYRWARKIRLILDHGIIHKSRIVQAWLAANGVKFELHFQPPYCPQANRIERLWKDLHDNVTRNHRHPTIAGLVRAVHTSANGFAWSRDAPMRPDHPSARDSKRPIRGALRNRRRVMRGLTLARLRGLDAQVVFDSPHTGRGMRHRQCRVAV